MTLKVLTETKPQRFSPAGREAAKCVVFITFTSKPSLLSCSARDGLAFFLRFKGLLMIFAVFLPKGLSPMAIQSN